MRPNLWCAQYGDAPAGDRLPVVLIPGAMSSARAWPRSFLSLISRSITVYALDLRDTGRNVRWGYSSCPYDLQTMADDVAHSMIVKRIRRAHVVGCSMGGAVAQLLAAGEASPSVASLSLLMSTSASGIDDPAQPRPSVRALSAMAHEWSLHERGHTRAALVFRAHSLAAPERLGPGEAARYARRLVRHGYHVRAAHGHAFSSSPSRIHALASVSVPSLVLHGTHDEVFPPSHAWILGQSLAHSRTIWLPRIGHFLSERTGSRAALATSAFWHDVESGRWRLIDNQK